MRIITVTTTTIVDMDTITDMRLKNIKIENYDDTRVYVLFAKSQSLHLVQPRGAPPCPE